MLRGLGTIQSTPLVPVMGKSVQEEGPAWGSQPGSAGRRTSCPPLSLPRAPSLPALLHVCERPIPRVCRGG